MKRLGDFDGVATGAAETRVWIAWAAAVVVIAGMLATMPPLYVVVGAGLLVALGAAAVRPTWALALVLLAIPFEIAVVNVGPVGISAVQMATLLVVVLMLVEMLATGRFEVARTPFDVPALLWAATLFLGAIGTEDPAATIKKAGLTLVFIALYYAVVAKVRTMKTVTLLMEALVLGGFVVGAYGVYVGYKFVASGAVTSNAVVVGSEGLAVPRASSTVGDPTLLGALMVLAIPIGAMLVATTKGWRRAFWVVALVTLFASLGFTFTRGAWIGAAAGLAVLVFERRARVVLIGVLLGVMLFAPGAIWQRAASSTNTGRYEISHRFDYWRAAFYVAPKRPLFGTGLASYRYEFRKLPVAGTAQRTAVHAHNVVLMVFAETGLVGLFSMGTIVVGSVWFLLRKRRGDPSAGRRAWRLAIAASIVGSLVHQMSDSFLLEPTVNAILWTYFALAVLFAFGAVSSDDEQPAARQAS